MPVGTLLKRSGLLIGQDGTCAVVRWDVIRVLWMECDKSVLWMWISRGDLPGSPSQG